MLLIRCNNAGEKLGDSIVIILVEPFDEFLVILRVT